MEGKYIIIVKLSILFFIGALLLIVFGGFNATKTYAANLSPWQKGATMYPTSSGDFSSSNFNISLQNLKSTGANYVTLVIPYYQDSLYSSNIYAGGNTPTDASLIYAINLAHQLGMKVMLKPHVDVANTNVWRGYISPTDKQAWFNSYTGILDHYANISNQYGVEEICIGTELISLSTYTSDPTNTAYWYSLIANLRSIYSGLLTYSANWGGAGFTDEMHHIAFWDRLDSIGISAYFSLTGVADDSPSNLENAWNNWRYNWIEPLHNQYNKPVLFTEIGYRSISNANAGPWDYNASAPSDQVEQANDYIALFDYWGNVSWMQGVQLWNWQVNPYAGGNGDTDYTPQNKQAQTVMTQWFTGSITSITPSVSPVFSVSSNYSPSTPVINQNISISTSVQVTNTSSNNLIVDLEIYNSSSQRVFQQFYSGQNFVQNVPNTYSINWTPNSTGSYKFEVGVFSSNWTSNYYWNANVLNLTVSQPQTQPQPPSGTYTIATWWPVNNVTVSGVQPFKATIYNLPLGSYNMYWKVDGGQLNSMYNSNTDSSHKESMVDLSGWNWKGSGPYTITFVATDLNGNTIATTSINIYISH